MRWKQGEIKLDDFVTFGSKKQKQLVTMDKEGPNEETTL